MAVLQLNSIKDTSLWNRLNLGFSGTDKELAQRLATYVFDISEEACDRMRSFASLHPEFTLHDEVHLLRVTELMSRIMPSSVADQLNPIEIALLILSAHFHDQGMVLERDELVALDSNQEYKIFRDNWEIEHPNFRDVKQRIRDKNLSDNELQRLREIERELNAALLTDYVRKTHGERSATFVRDKYNQDPRWMVSGTSIAELVARLCLSHVRPATDLSSINGFRFDESVGSYKVNMPYIGLILRLADILDLDRDRTPDSLYRTINFRSGVSLREWEKHRSVDGWVIEPTLIQFTMRCENPEYQRAAYQFMDLIDKELADAQHIIRNFPSQVASYQLNLPLAADRTRIEPKDDAYIYHDLEFSLSRDEIVKLLMTNKLYGGPWLCVRELLQNSLDALRYRKALIKRDNGTDWEQGKVEMYHDLDADGHEVFRCIDNGSGMDRTMIERFLTRVGRSYYRSPEFEQERASFRAAGVDFDPCAQFGIGFMSCFMLGDRIVVYTRRDFGPNRGHGEPLITEINGLGGIVVIRRGRSDQPVGTTVEILGRRKPSFVDEFTDQVKLLEVIEGYALACEFPIQAHCTIPEIEDSVAIPPAISVPRTAIEDSGLKNYVTIEKHFSDVHPLMSGSARASFIVDEEKRFTLANSEAHWEIVGEGNSKYIVLVSADGKEIERYYPRYENQVCIDGILVGGHSGRHDLSKERKYNTIGSGGSPVEIGRTVFTLDIRGEIKPPITPARTIPENRNIFGVISPRWNYISQFVYKAQGRLWEQVAEQLEGGMTPEVFWQLAIIYSNLNTDISWMRAGEIWSLISVPISYENNKYEWKKISSLGVLEPVGIREKTSAKKREITRGDLICADGGRIESYEQLAKWRPDHKNLIGSDLRYIAACMSTVRIDNNKAMFEPRVPSHPDLPASEFSITGGHDLSVLALPYSGEVGDFFSLHLPFKNCNREHPLTIEALRAKYLEQPSAFQEFATSAAFLLSSSEPLEVLVKPELPITRWHRFVGSRFMDVDWQTILPELSPPYKVRLEDGSIVQVSAEDFERWANAREYKK